MNKTEIEDWLVRNTGAGHRLVMELNQMPIGAEGVVAIRGNQSLMRLRVTSSPTPPVRRKLQPRGRCQRWLTGLGLGWQRSVTR